MISGQGKNTSDDGRGQLILLYAEWWVPGRRRRVWRGRSRSPTTCPTSPPRPPSSQCPAMPLLLFNQKHCLSGFVFSRSKVKFVLVYSIGLYKLVLSLWRHCTWLFDLQLIFWAFLINSCTRLRKPPSNSSAWLLEVEFQRISSQFWMI